MKLNYNYGTDLYLTKALWLLLPSSSTSSPHCSSTTMKSALMGSLKFQIPQLGFHKTLQKPHLPRSSVITCSLRGKPRPPLWRAKRLSTEAIQAIQSLKLARSSTPRLEEVFNSKLSRLLKTDLLDTLAVLQNQNELDLALKVNKRKEKEKCYYFCYYFVIVPR